jgi:hypothetical protein
MTIKLFRVILLSLGVLMSSAGFSQPQTIKVAVLENLKVEKLSTDKYVNDYMDGLQVAAKAAEKNNFKVDIKTFFYGKEPLAILEMVPEVKAWSPDIVIGPRSSSLFLMLRDQFQNTLVLSPFATANDVSELPQNFYSLTLPNDYFTQAVVNMVKTKFPAKHVAPIVEIDCKNCMDFAASFATAAKSSGVLVRERTSYLKDNAEAASVKDLVAQVKDSDIILLPNTSYTSGAVVARIADYLKRPELVVIGGDGWGDWSSSYFGKVKSQYKYSGYRVTPWSFDSTDERTQAFKREFKSLKGTLPTGTAALLSYSTLRAPFVALQRASKPRGDMPIRDYILAAFKEARAKDAHFQRPTNYAIYQVTQDGEKFAGEAPALTGEQNK